MTWCRSLIIALIGSCLLVPTAFSEIYKWVDENGKTHFSDQKPEQATVEEIEVKVNTITTPSILDSDFLEARDRRKVVMYSAVWCGVCKKAARYFREKKIPFKEYDIEKSRKGRQDYTKLNGRGVPIILVGKKRMNGFSASRFQSMYSEALR